MSKATIFKVVRAHRTDPSEDLILCVLDEEVLGSCIPAPFASTMSILGTKTVGYLPAVIWTSSPMSWELVGRRETAREKAVCDTLSLSRTNCLTQDSGETVLGTTAEVPLWVSGHGKMGSIVVPTVCNEEAERWIIHISQWRFPVKYWNKLGAAQALPPNGHPAARLSWWWPWGVFGRGAGAPASLSSSHQLHPGLRETLLESFRQTRPQLGSLTWWTTVEPMISPNGMESQSCLLGMALGMGLVPQVCCGQSLRASAELGPHGP